MTLYRQLAEYFILAYLFCCILWIPLFLSAFGIFSSETASLFLLIGAFGPMISALIVTFKSGGFTECSRLLRKLFLVRIDYRWYLLAFFIPIGIVLCVLGGLLLVSRGALKVHFMNPLEFIPGFLFALFIVTGEEVGWRGFALPRLQSQYNALTSSVILGVLWSIIHFPLFFVQPDRAAGVNILIVVPGFILLMVLLSIITTFLYNGAQGSILIPCIHHASLGMANHLYKSPNHDYDLIAMYLFLAVTFILALVITVKYGPANLSPKMRVVHY